MISDQAQLDDALVAQLLQMGHSRVPVYRGEDRDDIIGLVLVKELLQVSTSTAAYARSRMCCLHDHETSVHHHEADPQSTVKTAPVVHLLPVWPAPALWLYH